MHYPLNGPPKRHEGPIYYDPDENRLIQVRAERDGMLICSRYVIYMSDTKTCPFGPIFPVSQRRGWIEVKDPSKIKQLRWNDTVNEWMVKNPNGRIARQK